MEFLGLGSVWRIYVSYQIPNNHILFTLALRGWIDVWQTFLPIPDFAFRLPSFLFSLGCVMAVWRLWRRRMPRSVVLAALAAFITSPAFEIYGVAVRGYMLNMLLGVIALEAAFLVAERLTLWRGAMFAAAAVGLVGVMPSNAAFLAGASFIALPSTINRASLARWSFLPLTSFAALVLFYAPIARRFIGSMSLKEGWLSPFAAATHFYAALALLSPALPLVALGGIALLLRHRPFALPILFRSCAWATALLIPLAVALLRTPSPFPRVFSVFLILWLFALGIAVQRVLAFVRLRRGGKVAGVCGAALIAVSAACGIAATRAAPELSMLLTPNSAQDDFYHPYFMSGEFNPRKASSVCAELMKTEGARIYLSSGADPLAIMFYGKIYGVSDLDWLVDRPRLPPVTRLPLDERPVYLLTRGGGDLAQVVSRFGVAATTPLADCGFQKIDKVQVQPHEQRGLGSGFGVQDNGKESEKR